MTKFDKHLVKSGSFDIIRDFDIARVEYNEKIKKIISDHDNIYWLGANSESAKPVDGNVFLVDGMHKYPYSDDLSKIPKTKYDEEFNYLPPSLYYDIQRIYNLICNSKMFKNLNNTCCVDYFHSFHKLSPLTFTYP